MKRMPVVYMTRRETANRKMIPERGGCSAFAAKGGKNMNNWFPAETSKLPPHEPSHLRR
jgi:hypothetical protein